MRTRLYMKSFSEVCLKTAASLHTTGSPSGVSWNRKSPAYFLSYTNKYITTIKTRDQYRTRFSADYKQVTRCNRFERKALLYDADKISSLFYFLIHRNCQSPFIYFSSRPQTCVRSSPSLQSGPAVCHNKLLKYFRIIHCLYSVFRDRNVDISNVPVVSFYC